MLCNKNLIFFVEAYIFNSEVDFFAKMENVKNQASSEAEIFKFGIFLTRRARQSMNVTNIWNKRKLERFSARSKPLVNLRRENLLLEVDSNSGKACPEVEEENVGNSIEVQKVEFILPDVDEPEDIDVIVNQAAEQLVAGSESDPLTFEVKGLVFFFW